MPSLVWTADSLFQAEAAMLADLEDIPLAWVQRFELVGLMQYKVVAAFYSVMAAHYMTPVYLQSDTAVNFSSGAASYSSSLRRLTAVMSAPFSPSDVGKIITFRTATEGYVGQVEAYVSATVVGVSGNMLPTVDIASVTDIMLLTTSITNDMISLASLPIMRSGDQVQLHLESSATSDVRAVGLPEIQRWQEADPRHSSGIVWCYSGDYLLLRTALASYGTLRLNYPRSPRWPLVGTDKIDLPDGPVIALGGQMLRKMIDERYVHTGTKYDNELAAGAQQVAQNYGLELTKESLKQKVDALK
jgi:hypothetical protein